MVKAFDVFVISHVKSSSSRVKVGYAGIVQKLYALMCFPGMFILWRNLI